MVKDDRSYPCITINDQLFELIKTEEITVRAGNRSTRAKVLNESDIKPTGKLSVCLNYQTSKELMIPESCYRDYCMDNNNIFIGPVVGVLTTAERTNKLYPIGKKARLFKEMIFYGKQQGVFIYFFNNKGINWKKKIIRGYTCTENMKWVSGYYPFPNIVYNRILNRHIEGKKSIKTMLESFNQDQNTYLFNTRFFDKWEVHQALTRCPQGREFVPETVLLNRRRLRDFTVRYPEVFLKPRNGYRGRGLIKIKSLSKNKFIYACAGLSSIKWKKSSSFSSLYKQISQLTTGNNRYILQQAIDLTKYEGRIFDLRTQVQKNGEGNWVMAGVAARVAGKNHFVTHISNGGSAGSYEEVINIISGNSDELKAHYNTQLKNICLLVPRILDKELGLKLAVLSMDIGLDSSGRMWVIEVNSKPGSFDEDDIRKRYLKYLVDYCIFIAKRNN